MLVALWSPGSCCSRDTLRLDSQRNALSHSQVNPSQANHLDSFSTRCIIHRLVCPLIPLHGYQRHGWVVVGRQRRVCSLGFYAPSTGTQVCTRQGRSTRHLGSAQQQ
jgi:hypothetical protein